MAALESLQSPAVEHADRPDIPRTAEGVLSSISNLDGKVLRLAHDVEVIQHEGLPGHRAELTELITEARPMMWNRVFNIVHDPHNSDDLTQDACVTVCTHIDRLREPTHFLGWAGTVAARTALHWARRRHPMQSFSGGQCERGDMDVIDTRTDPAVQMRIAEERARLVHCVLESLYHGDRDLLTRFYIDNLSLAELRQELGNIPMGTVKRRLFTARQRFEQRYKALSSRQ